ncbi:protein lap1 [Cladorrhinum sp. PSN259]|nr:protein lap1 [Cladorrhinum sp. PSN259]
MKQIFAVCCGILVLLKPAASNDLPSLSVSLLPIIEDPHGKVTAINVTLRIRDSRLRANQPIVALDLNHGPTPTTGYDDDALAAADDLGPLQLVHTDSNATDSVRTWVINSTSRDPVGDIIIRCVARPRVTSAKTTSGPRVDLRDDQGGLVSMGTGFIPYPPDEDDWNVTVGWDMDGRSTPNSIRFASSLGEDKEASVVGAPSRVLEKAYFTIGPLLQRWPPWDPPGINTTRDFALYWHGTLPYAAERVSATMRDAFLAMSSFFNDTTSPFRVFWRRVWTGYGGASGFQSFLIEYAAGTEAEQSESALTNLVAHETIHAYALPYPPGRQFDLWYREGVAQYYAVMAPFYAGSSSRADFIKWLNNYAQAYYTGGTVEMTWQEVVDNYWTGVEVVKTPYTRGFIYLATVQGIIHRATRGEKSLDDIVLELYRRFLAREKCQTEEFIELLAGIVGNETAQASFASMTNGSLIVPSSDAFAKFGLKMVRQDAEKLDLGFDSRYLGSRVQGLKTGSRAEQAGLREGDKIVRSWALWGAGDSLDNQMEVVVQRNGSDVAIRYWPRSYAKVENWEWVEYS